MIKRKLKKCRLCGEDKFLFSHGRCKECTLQEEAYTLKKSPVNKISKKEQQRKKVYQKLRLDYLNMHPICEACGTVEATEIHHRAGRIGPNLFRYFMSICRNCHNWIHNNIQESYDKGWLLKRN